MNKVVMTPLFLTGALLLSASASAELEMGDSGGAKTVQARFEAFSTCNQNARAKGLGDKACDKEAKALREMIGGGSAKNSSKAKTYKVSSKQNAKK